MSELLFEILSEEIPSRMQINAANQLKQLFTEAIAKLSIKAQQIESFVTPRRLTLYVDNIEVDISGEQEIRGPRVDGPKAAIEGFATKYNIAVSELQIKNTDKGSFYFLINKPKNINLDLELTNILNKIMQNFYWPKSMRWGNNNQYWVRPIRNILCLYDGKVLPVEYINIKANRKTKGHRFLSNEFLEIRYFNDYKENLYKNYVVLDSKDRENIIKFEIDKAITPLQLNCKFESNLVNEVVGLVEWPKILIGEFDQEYLKIPAAIIELTIKTHQRYFPLYDDQGNLANKFAIVANIKQDLGQVIKGNQKVVAARLADAKYFYEQDLNTDLDTQINKLSKLSFHQHLGGMDLKCERMKNLSLFLACWVPFANLIQVERAAKLAKFDLVTNIVGEFPELQGEIGAHYAEHKHEDSNIITAIAEHYLPSGPDSPCPTNPISITTALADKIDTIMGFFIIGEKPTSSKDPYALRRAVIGIIRIIVENKIALPLNTILEMSHSFYKTQLGKTLNNFVDNKQVVNDVMEFIWERFKFFHKSQNTKSEIFEAITSNAKIFDLYYLTQKINFLNEKSHHSQFDEVLNAFIRIEKIIAHEKSPNPKVNTKYFYEEAEKELYEAWKKLEKPYSQASKDKNLSAMWQYLIELIQPINNFFENVMVNIDDQQVKNNRISLLMNILELSKEIGDLNKIANK